MRERKRLVVRPIASLLLLTALLVFAFSADAHAASETRLYHLHAESSAIDTAARVLSQANPDISATTITGPTIDSAGDKIVAAFETQAGDPNYSRTVPAGSTWTFEIWARQDGTTGVGYPRVRLYHNSATGTLLVDSQSSGSVSGTITKYTWTGANSFAIAFSSSDRIYAVVSINYATAGLTGEYSYLGIEGTSGGATDSTIKAPLDSSPPTTTLTTDPVSPDGTNGWFRTAPTITLTADEPATTYYQWNTTTGAWTAYSSSFKAPEGQHALYYYSQDVYGNVESLKSTLFKVDTASPSSSITDPAEGARLRGSSYTVKGSSEDAGSLVSSVEVSTNGGTTWAAATNTGVDFSSWEYLWTLPADGSYNLKSRAKDNAGNLEVAGAGVNVTVDNTAPTVTETDPADGALHVATTASVKATFSEEMDASTITTLTFLLHDGVTYVAGTVSYSSSTKTATFTLSADLKTDTLYTATITGVKDLAGNALSANKVFSFTTVDTIAPTTTLTTEPTTPDGTNGWFRTAPTITLTASEPATTYYQWDSTTGAWITYASPFKALEGSHILYYYSVDTSENVENTKSQLIKVDTKKPVAEIRVPAGGENIRQTVSIVGTANDVNLDTYGIYYGAGSAPVTWHDIGTNPHTIPAFEEKLEKWNTTAVSDGLYTLRLVTLDMAGNTSEALQRVTVDNTSPMVSSAVSIGYMAVDVVFNETNTLEAASSQNLSHYAITPSLAISKASLQLDGKTVRLLTDIQSATSYTLTVTNVKDQAGNLLGSPNSASFVGQLPGSAAPQNATATAEPDPSHNVVIVWSPPAVGQADYYNVYRYIYAIDDQNKNLADEVASHLVGSERTYVDGTGIPGETYFYAVTAIDVVEGAEFESPVSNSPSATVSGKRNPHQTFTTSTNLCKDCHKGHQAVGEFAMTRRETREEVCYVCHDGTGSSYNIKGIYDSQDTYAGHRTQTPGSFAAGTQIRCDFCHNPHFDATANKFLMNTEQFAHDGTTKSLPASPTRDFRDVCVICHENDTTKPRTVAAGLTLPYITIEQDITHATSDTSYCKKCHANTSDQESAHSPTVIVKAPEAEDINVLGTDVLDSSASGGMRVALTASTTAIEVVLDYNGATSSYLDIGNYGYIIRARVKATTTTARFKVAVNDVLGPEVPLYDPNTWQVIDLGAFTLTGINDNLKFGVIDPGGGQVYIDRVYFCRI